MDWDQPDLDEIEKMLKFCKRYKNIFIYGNGEIQKYLADFLDVCKVKYNGFIILEGEDRKIGYPAFSPNDARKFSKYFNIGKFNRKNIYNAGILVIDGLNPYYLQEAGFKNFFFISELNKRNIPLKMRPHTADELGIEYNLVDHCNLNCKSCDHCSPIADEFFITKEEFEKDMKRLSEITNDKLQRITLMGGEPLLHPELISLLKIARKYFKNTPVILHSNGILLLKDDALWSALKEYDIILCTTTYPVKVDYKKIDEKAKEYGIKYNRFAHVGDQDYEGLKWLRHAPYLLKHNAPLHYFISCYHFNDCITLRHGKIYTCPFKPYSQHFVKYFNKPLHLKDEDCIDIYKINSFEEIANFCNKRTQFCSYCDIKNRVQTPFEISKKSIKEWI